MKQFTATKKDKLLKAGAYCGVCGAVPSNKDEEKEWGDRLWYCSEAHAWEASDNDKTCGDCGRPATHSVGGINRCDRCNHD